MSPVFRGSVKPLTPIRVATILGALAILFVPSLFRPDYAHAQASGLKVTILRPGEGETIYSSASPPYAAIPITGLVATNDFSLSQLQVKLEVIRGSQTMGSVPITPSADGTFRVDVGINQHPVSDLAEEEQGCDGRCHQYQSLILPTGQLVLRVTATDPLGRKAVAQRSIVVDAAGYVNLPVQVVADGESGRALSGVKVVASTRLLEWRTRQFSAVTDASGKATLHLERLSENATHYVLQIEPGIANGVFVTNQAGISVTLPPGASSAAPVTLAARTQHGQISGKVESQGMDLTGLAIRMSNPATGEGRTATVAQGKFILSDVPLAKYLLTLDVSGAKAQDVYAEAQMIDLTVSATAMPNVKVVASPRTVRGAVHDATGNPVPFAWVAANEENKTARVSPTTGAFVLGGLDEADRALWVTAPGYYSRPIAVAHQLDIKLYPRPDTRQIPWGPGSITLPSQTLADVSGGQISLRRGWIWGKGNGSFTIRMPELDVVLSGGTFVLEYLPGETNWVYLREGQAVLVTSDGNVNVGAGQMVSFGRGVANPKPVPLDDAVVQALQSGKASQVPIETDSELTSRLVNEIEQLGLSVFQAVGLAVALIGLGAIGVVAFVRHRRAIHPNG